uniref:Integrin alpha FG-GAP repeat containing 1 n=1 Tax=Amphiprion percula TaxID=161767 RepID=A0A3P8S073_AMPPE
MWIFNFYSLAFLSLFLGQYNTFALQDVTTDLFGAANYGVVAAFGDFNSDKQTDIFIIRELVIFLADSKSPYFKPKINISNNTVVTSVVPGDYDGDSQMDVLITAQINSKSETVFVFWGNNQTLGNVTVSKLTSSFFLLKLNFLKHGTFKSPCCLTVFLPFRIAVWKNALSSAVSMRIPHSNAFIDLNKDFTAGESVMFKQCLTMRTNVKWLGFFKKNNAAHFLLVQSYVVASPSIVVFLFLADGDGYQDHLLPACLDESCQHSAIFLAKSGSKEWVQILSDFQQRETIWSFVPGKPSQPLALHLGDYNLDGFPDALVVLHNTSGSNQQAFLLENVPCQNPSCHNVGRMFHIHWDQSDLGAIQNATMATFFDIYEDGILDMLVLSQAEGKKDLIIHALKNNFEADAYFVKVMVLSGLCSNDCPEDPFGVNQPGPYVMYTTLDSNGYLKNASAGQLSQSAHFSLQLPYTVLGLGRSANFLDHLFVGIPRQPGETGIRKQEWTAIIPNSQLIVMPFPHNKPRSWSAKLYLTPSNSVLLTAIALIGVCVFILVIIGILHWQEKKADDREKRQEAHRFHFDAM